MSSSHPAHEKILAVFDELGADPASPMAESVLVRDGFLVGRRFQREGIRIVWFFDAAELKVWGADNKLVKVLSLTPQHRQAA
ncbi:MAG: hypothetical protein K8T91_11475 [Planctomycetes bacterium]|nr:hypothetical protein [Planctomycetota bacterium]